MNNMWTNLKLYSSSPVDFDASEDNYLGLDRHLIHFCNPITAVLRQGTVIRRVAAIRYWLVASC